MEEFRAEQAGRQSIRDRVARNYQRMTPAERSLADLVIAHPEQVVELTIGDIAARAGVGTSVVSRFGQRIGMGGFRTLRLVLARELGTSTSAATGSAAETLAGGEGGPADPIGNAARIASAEAIEAITLNARSLDYGALRAAAELMVVSNRVVTVGYGTSAVVAQRLASMLLRDGWTARAEAEPMNDSWRGDLDTGDLVIAITHRGRVPRMIAALPDIRDHGARLIAVTNIPDSAVGRAADVVLATCVPGGESDSVYQLGPVLPVQLVTVRALVAAAAAARVVAHSVGASA